MLLVDDNSADGTAETATRTAADCTKGDRLAVLSGAPLPRGWTGKVWAMQQGLEWAGRQDPAPDLLLFTDADISYPPDGLCRLVAQRERAGSVLTSAMVRLRAASLAERLLVPAFVFFFRMLYPFRWVSDPTRTRVAAAAGGAMLVQRSTLQGAGGLASIRNALIDDCALGRLMKARGPLWLGLASDIESVRAYPRVDDIRRMVARSAYAELRHSPARLALALAGLALVFVVPPLALMFGSDSARWLGLAGFAAMTLAFAPIVRFYRLPVWTALTLPAIAAIYAAFTLDSAAQHWRGRGGVWKGRVAGGAEETAAT